MDWFFQFSGLLQLKGNEKGIQSKRIQRFDEEQKKKPACCIKTIQTEGQNLKKEIQFLQQTHSKSGMQISKPIEILSVLFKARAKAECREFRGRRD